MFSCRCKFGYHRMAESSSCKIPLKSVSFSSVVQNSLVNLTILQTFTNEEQIPIECEYMFSVAKDSAIISLIFHLADGTILKSKVWPKNIAMEAYDDTIAEGNTAALGKIKENKKMTILIGNLAPNDSIRVELNLVFPLSTDESHWELSIPTGFLPASDCDSLLSFDFLVMILSQSPITLYSSNCSIDFKLSPDALLLHCYLPPGTYENFPNKNFSVKFRSSNTNTPSCIIQQIGSRCIAMLSFIPFNTNIKNLGEVEGQGEFIFLLDRRESMEGDRIEMAKKAIVLFLNSLPSGSLFNIISFGGELDFMFSKSQPNNSKFVKSAIKNVLSFAANMGRNYIREPLSQVFTNAPLRGYPRTIFLLTDGEVINPEQVIEIIEKNSRKCRVHWFGIGEDVNASLINKIAKAGNGCASFIKNKEDIGKKVISALQKCIIPCVTEFQIDWKGECYPNTDKIGSLYYGERCIQYIMLDEKPNRALNIKFFDNYSKKLKKFSISNFKEIPGDSIFKLWTKGKLDYLLENSSRNANKIIQLSIESGIPTKLTSFICVKENGEPITEEMVTRKVEKKDSSLSFRQFVNFIKPQNRNRYTRNELYSSKFQNFCSFISSMVPSMAPSRARSMAPRSIKSELARNSGANLYFSIISKIKTEGFWAYQDFIDELPEIKRIPEGLAKCIDKKNVICTLFILAYLHKNFQDKFDEWVLIERKVLKWLRFKKVSFKDLQETINSYLS